MVESCNDEIDRTDSLSTLRRLSIQDIIKQNKDKSFEVISNKIKAYSLDKNLKILGVKDGTDFISVFLKGIEYQFKKES